MAFTDVLKHAWNAFTNRDPTKEYRKVVGTGYSANPDRIRFTRGNERSIVTGIYNRIAMDAASMSVVHARMDENGRFSEEIRDGLNECLTLSANLDQTARAFLQDVVASMLDEGVVAIVPVITDDDTDISNAFDIYSMRVGQVVEWFPTAVRVRVYDERDGLKKEIIVPKHSTPIIENPFYPVMNEPNSIAKRLNRKLVLLDAVDEQSGSGKLDLIVQLPYVVRSESQKIQAENRRKSIETQLAGSKYGIAYTDATEKITQLNRSLENNLLNQITYLQELLFSQCGITQSVMDGTADETTMINYYSRTIEPIMSVIVDEMKRKFLTKTARTQRQTIYFYRDPFKLVPVSQISEIADKFTRNEILTSNEIRQIIGIKPSTDPNADVLRNKNLNQAQNGGGEGLYGEGDYDSQIGEIDDIDRQIAELQALMGGEE